MERAFRDGLGYGQEILMLLGAKDNDYVNLVDRAVDWS